MAEMDKDSYLHGSAASRMLRELETGVPTCVTVTLVDGLVLSRSAFDHSMNYRSVVAFGTARKVVDPEQKIKSLRLISEHLIAGRWREVRGPSEKELKATTVIESSATTRFPVSRLLALAYRSVRSVGGCTNVGLQTG
jgi:nitroimidazol reductase NimA-like FMN-containing flavoprotein (pyridoxamine 5'-phosphate oxidase superfamily)